MKNQITIIIMALLFASSCTSPQKDGAEDKTELPEKDLAVETIHVKGPTKIDGDYSTFLYFDVEEVTQMFVNPDGSLSGDNVAFAIPYKKERQAGFAKNIEDLEREFVKNRDENKKYILKYIDAEVYDSKDTEIACRLIVDFEVIN